MKIDPGRAGMKMTGIFVRATDESGHTGSFDVAELDAESLHAWLRSRGGENVWAENVVAILLGHDTTESPWCSNGGSGGV